MTSISFCPAQGAPFIAALDTVRLDNVRLTKFAISEGRGEHLCDTTKQDDCVVLLLQKAGTSLLQQDGRAANLSPDDFAFVEAARPFTWELGPGSECLSIRVGADDLCRHVEQVAVAQTVSGQMPTTRILAKVLEIIWDEALESPTPRAGQIILEAMSLAAQPLAGMETAASGSQIFQRALNIIDRKLRDPTLSVTEIASQLCISPRYLQRLFAQRGTTPRAQVAQQRIRYAARLLSVGRFSVTGAAMEAGFNDLSHFGRIFRKTFGESPRDYRRRWTGGAAA